MIDLSVLHIDWINEASTRNNKADKILVEKVVRALLLLEGLSVSSTNEFKSCLSNCSIEEILRIRKM